MICANTHGEQDGSDAYLNTEERDTGIVFDAAERRGVNIFNENT